MVFKIFVKGLAQGREEWLEVIDYLYAPSMDALDAYLKYTYRNWLTKSIKVEYA